MQTTQVVNGGSYMLTPHIQKITVHSTELVVYHQMQLSNLFLYMRINHLQISPVAAIYFKKYVHPVWVEVII